jgi:2,5-diamino-6-(ribosylamino)-4(3H)-pyrimidinone 5'-phosphate reductase
MSARPYVICHMMSSVDGRIQSLRWGVKDAAQFFEKQAAKIKVDAWMVGRKTMQEFSSKAARRARKTSARIGKQDFIAAGEAKSFAVVIDPSGKCNWQESEVQGDHVIEVLTEKVSADYLAHLREAGVSYLFAGKRQLDLQLVLEKLAQHFGIERVRLDGGGGNNGSFLAAGLIDELSLVLMPVADGSTGTPTVFDAGPGDSRHKSAKLTLQSVKRLDGGALWLRYLVER